MHIVLVHIHVKRDALEAFRHATLENASSSVQEAGVVRFDFIQQADNPNRFTLIEVYKNPEAQAAHRETAHYLKWRDGVADMMAEPRQGLKYTNIFPTDEDW